MSDHNLPGDATTAAQPSNGMTPGLKRLQDKLRACEISQAEFNAWMDSVEPFTCSREEMLELIEAVPNDFLGGFLLGIYSFRVMMANVSGRGY